MPAACFSVDGAWFTDMVRSMWADEGTPEKGIKLLRTSIPELDQGTIIQILTGEKKLTGNSSEGLELEDDDTQESPGGNLLSMEDVMAHFHRRERNQKDDHEYHSGLVELVYYEPGKPVLIPKNRVEEVHRGETNIEDIPHRIPTGLEIAECWDPEERRWDSRREGSLARDACNYTDAVVREPVSLIDRLSCGDPLMAQAAKTILDPPEFDTTEYASTITTKHGWLSPDGKYYPCQWFEHTTLARQLGDDDATQMEKTWVKVSKGEAFPPDRGFTQRQMDLVFDMYVENDGKLPEWWEYEMEKRGNL